MHVFDQAWLLQNMLVQEYSSGSPPLPPLPDEDHGKEVMELLFSPTPLPKGGKIKTRFTTCGYVELDARFPPES